MSDPKREFLRHTLATLAYRGSKVIRDASEEFAQFQAGPSTRKPVTILAHIGDLLAWGLSIAEGKPSFYDSRGESWAVESERFYKGLAALDDFLASDAELQTSVEKLFQGPIADALTHVGQIAMLRRLAGEQIRGENYYVANIETGLTGPNQNPARKEFD